MEAQTAEVPGAAPRARPTVKVVCELVAGVPLLAAVLVTASRVGATARFVTWSVLAFTALAAAVALIGLWFGLDRPGLLAAGVVPALIVSYFLPATPLVAVTVVLVLLAVAAARVRRVVAGMAMTIGAVMVLFVVIQGPAVECGASGVSSNSGPWWIPSASSSSSGSSGGLNGEFSGTTQVGEHHYAFTCAGARLTHFERVP
jgi:hypothetical protein